MHTEFAEYTCQGKKHRGYLAYETDKEKLPAIIIAPAWRGLDEFAMLKARELASMGYASFAADIYGDGIHVESNEEAAKLMMPLFLNRKELRSRMTSAFNFIKEHPLVDSTRIGAIGYCFGGLSVIELLRSGADVKGVVSFHGLLGYELGDQKAEELPHGGKIRGALLVLRGYLDPLVSEADVRGIEEEFSYVHADWQIHTYGNAMHAFTNPEANEPDSGLLYNHQASQRSWIEMSEFFQEVMK